MEWQSAYRPERRANWEDIATAVRYAIHMDAVLDFYCPHLPRKNHRCPCPIHNGKDPNFSYTDQGYKCFVCGASGDVIAFVKEVCELSTRADAMKKINADFSLRLPIGGTLSATQSATLALRREEAERKQKERDDWLARYHELMDEWVQLDIVKRTEDPTSEEYAEAVSKIDYVAYQLDCLPPEPR